MAYPGVVKNGNEIERQERIWDSSHETEEETKEGGGVWRGESPHSDLSLP